MSRVESIRSPNGTLTKWCIEHLPISNYYQLLQSTPHLILTHALLPLHLPVQTMTIAAVDETDYNLWLDALSDTLEIREMAIQVPTV